MTIPTTLKALVGSPLEAFWLWVITGFFKHYPTRLNKVGIGKRRQSCLPEWNGCIDEFLYQLVKRLFLRWVEVVDVGSYPGAE